MKKLKDWLANLWANIEYFADVHSDALFNLLTFLLIVIASMLAILASAVVTAFLHMMHMI